MPTFEKMRFLILFILIIASSTALKVLLYSPNFSRSHINLIGKLADIYIENGHEAIIYRPELYNDDPDKLVNGSKARVIWQRKNFETSLSSALMQSNVWKVGSGGFLKSMKDASQWKDAFGDAMTKMCEQTFADTEMLQYLRDQKFDIGFIQLFDPCGVGLFKKIGLERTILISSMPLPIHIGDMFGIPSAISFVPDFYPISEDYGNFVKRAVNVAVYYFTTYIIIGEFQRFQIEAVRKEYPEFTLESAFGNASLVFVNSDEHVELPRPISHKIVYIGGFALSQPKPLVEPYKSILDKAKDGVILVSFGSIAQSSNMPEEIKQVFLDTFKAIPKVKFIWKYEKPEEDIAKGLDNVLLAKWVPQTDVLNHKNLIGFVTHGGMNSVSEASHFGVPMICIYLFADQYRNCRTIEDRGLGLIAKKSELTNETLISAFGELINNKKYYKKAQAISQMIKGKPMQPAERVLKYTEYAAKFEISEVLELEGRHLNLIQFYNVDVYASLILIVSLSIYVFYRVVRCCCCRRKAVKAKKE